MKIEKLNDKQIRCTLTRADLDARHLQLNELAYGSDKARRLFNEMMQAAAREFGFVVENMPIMVEAIPATSDSIVLIITKCDNPEELDARFSKFSTAAGAEAAGNFLDKLRKLDGADDLLGIIDKMKKSLTSPSEAKVESTEAVSQDTSSEESEDTSLPVRLFSFASLDSSIRACKLLVQIYDGDNTLYKDEEEDVYILGISKGEYANADFNRICNMLSEYGSAEDSNPENIAFLVEHCSVIVAHNAVQALGAL